MNLLSPLVTGLLGVVLLLFFGSAALLAYDALTDYLDRYRARLRTRCAATRRTGARSVVGVTRDDRRDVPLRAPEDARELRRSTKRGDLVPGM